MKKLFLALLIAAMLLSSVNINVFAAITSNGESNTEVTYNSSNNGGIDSADWSVTVPASLTAGVGDVVTARGSFAPYDILSVTTDDNVKMHINGDSSADFALVPVTYSAIALSGSYDGEVSHSEAVTVDKDNSLNAIKYGSWEGVLNFYIEVKHDQNYNYSVIKGADLCVHDWSTAVNLGDGRHYRSCKICNKNEYAAHIYTPTEDSLTYNCVCGDSFTLDTKNGSYAVKSKNGNAVTYTSLDAAIDVAKANDEVVVILDDMTEVYNFPITRAAADDFVVIDPNGKKILLNYNSTNEIKLLADYKATDILAEGSIITLNETKSVEFDKTADAQSTMLVVSATIDNTNKQMDVYNKFGLELLANRVNGGNTHAGWYVYLCNDIDLKNEEWTPIGSNSKAFSGSFDGNGHTISNLKITTTKTRQGLFGLVSASGTTYFRNLTIHNASVTASTNASLLIGEASGGNVSSTGNHHIITNIKVTGKVTIDGYCGVAAIMCAGNAAEISNIEINTEPGSYISNTKKGVTSTWSLVGSIKSFGYVGKIYNIKSNIDVSGNKIGVGGLFGIIGGSSDNKVPCQMNDVSYSGNVSVNISSDVYKTGGKYYYQYVGLLVGAPRFTLIADQNTCTSNGTLTINCEETVKTSNDLADDFTWGVDLFGASRDNNYTNKSYSKTYVAK